MEKSGYNVNIMKPDVSREFKPKMSVVVLDDEEKVCRLLIQLVNWDALRMTLIGTAHNGLDGLSLVKRTHPDLVITDIRMPGMDGLELIGKIKGFSDTTEFVIVSGHNQFEYARKAIHHNVEDYLLKPIRKSELNETLERISHRHGERLFHREHTRRLQARLENSLEKLRLDFFRDCILPGAPSCPPNVAMINDLYGYSFREGRFIAVLIKLDCKPQAYSRKMMEHIEEKAQNLVRTGLEGLYFDLEFYCQKSKIYVVINYPHHYSSEIRKELKRANDELQLKASIFETACISMGLGSEAHHPSMLSASAGDADQALGSRLFDRSGKFFEQAPGSHRGVCDNFLAEWNRKMEHVCDTLDDVAASSAVETLVSRMHDEPHCTGTVFLETIQEAGHRLFTLLKDRNARGIDDWTALVARFDADIDIIPGTNELRDYLITLLEELFDIVREARKQAYSKPVRDAKQLIAKNFRNKTISLEQISESVELNPSYLSSLFKAQTGMGFLEYLTCMRIEAAKERLRGSGKTIALIASHVGYSDTRYFTRLFKKHTGLKPGEYRKLYG